MGQQGGDGAASKTLPAVRIHSLAMSMRVAKSTHHNFACCSNPCCHSPCVLCTASQPLYV